MYSRVLTTTLCSVPYIPDQVSADTRACTKVNEKMHWHLQPATMRIGKRLLVRHRLFLKPTQKREKMTNNINNKFSGRIWGVMLIVSGLVAGCGGGGGRDPILGNGGDAVVAPPTGTTLPQVISTFPVTTPPGPTPSTPANSSILAAFSKDMAAATINNSSFTLSCAAPCVAPAGTVNYTASSRSATFAPLAPLQVGATYTATVTMAATDTAGNHLAGNQAPLPASSDYKWTFVASAPTAAGIITVASTNPASNATLICPTGSINATFTVPNGLRLDPSSVNASTFTLNNAAVPNAPVPVAASSISVDAATGTIASFQPAATLASNTLYTVVLKNGSAGIKDLANPADTLAPPDYTWNFTTGDASSCKAPTPIQLGSASTFGTFGGTAGMTNSGLLSLINGDIGTTAVSTAVTGFHDVGPGCTYTETPLNAGLVNGRIFTAAPPPTAACPSEGNATTFSIASKAAGDALIAYNALAALPAGSDQKAGSLDNLKLAPGVYTAAAGSFTLQNNPLTLDAQGNPNATFVFQMASSLTVGGPGAAFPQSVILINGAQAKNVFWQVGSQATINAGGGGTMVGTIIAKSGIVFSTAGSVNPVTLNGRALSLGASVTLVNTKITVPVP